MNMLKKVFKKYTVIDAERNRRMRWLNSIASKHMETICLKEVMQVFGEHDYIIVSNETDFRYASIKTELLFLVDRKHTLFMVTKYRLDGEEMKQERTQWGTDRKGYELSSNEEWITKIRKTLNGE